MTVQRQSRVAFAANKQSLAKEVRVLGGVAGPLLRHGILGKDGGYWTFWLAGATIDALVRVDVVLVFTLIDAVNGANLDARRVLGSNAGLGNNVWHNRRLLSGGHSDLRLLIPPR